MVRDLEKKSVLGGTQQRVPIVSAVMNCGTEIIVYLTVP